MKDKSGMTGSYHIEAVVDGKVVQTWDVANMLTAISASTRVKLLTEGVLALPSENLQIRYMAFGTGTTAPTINDTQLENEVYRKQITQITAPTSIGQTNTVQSVVSLGTNEANFTIREIGVFCGTNATTSANTGTLLSRVAVNIPKFGNMTLNIVRKDICTIN